jgi:imidazolonepropionase-like amidohydrolase
MCSGFSVLRLLLLLAASLRAETILIQNVTVIDATGAKPAVRSVLIDGDRIARIEKKIKPPAEARVVDGQGKFLIPGLCDMHVHGSSFEKFPQLFVANGVTCVRDMYTPMPSIRAVREQIAAGAIIGPRILAAGRLIDGPKPLWPGSLSVSTPEEARAAVATALSEGSEFIKVYSGLSPESYRAIAEEAKSRGVVFAGHPPRRVSAAEASDLGQKSIEHLEQVLVGCSSREQEFLETGAVSGPEALLESYDEKKCTALIEKFRVNQTWHCPTLTVIRNLSMIGDPALTEDPRLAYMPAFVRATWSPQGGLPYLKTWGPKQSEQMKVTLAKFKEIVGRMNKAGVPLLAGTDVMNPFVMPGFSLHDELALLVESRLSPMQALQAATRNAAQYRGDLADYGTIEKGKVADLVLLNANPLADIRGTTRIAAVIVGGKLLDREKLDQLLGGSPAVEAERPVQR